MGDSALESSYADPTIGIVQFNILAEGGAGGRYGLELLALARKPVHTGQERSEYGERLRHFVRYLRRSLYVHEWFHILQAAHYPFVYLDAVRQWNLYQDACDGVRMLPAPTISMRLPMNPLIRQTIEQSQRAYHVRIDPVARSVDVSGTQSEYLERGDISEAQLLEEDASIFQYRVEIGAAGTGAGYQQWLWERSRYRVVFDYLRTLFGDSDRAVALLPILVRAAYQTTLPMTAFAYLAGWSVFTGKPDTEAPEEAYALCMSRLEKLPMEHGDMPALEQMAGDDKFHMITDSDLAELCAAAPRSHPLNGLVQIVLKRRKDSQYPSWWFKPFTLFDRSRLSEDESLSALTPPLTIIRLLDRGVPLGHQAMLPNMEIAPADLRSDKRMWPGGLLMALARKQLVLGMFTEAMDVYRHWCPHNDCVDRSALCKRWPFVPDDWTNCGFPNFLTTLTDRRVASPDILAKLGG